MMTTAQPPLSPQEFAQQALENYTPKEMAQRVLNNLPDDASYEDIMYRLYVAEKVADGLQAVARGETHSTDEVEQMLEESLKTDTVQSANG